MFRFLLLCLQLALTNALVLSPVRPTTSAATTSSFGSPIVMMAKKMKGAKLVKVVLESDVDGLGLAGDLVEVKPAYADNFIVAKKLGSVASQETIAKIAEDQAAKATAAAAALKKASKDKQAIDAKYGKAGLVQEVQVDADGNPKAPVTINDVAADLSRAGFAVDAAAIEMPDITILGSEVAKIHLHPDVTVMLKVNVLKSKIVFV